MDPVRYHLSEFEIVAANGMHDLDGRDVLEVSRCEPWSKNKKLSWDRTMAGRLMGADVVR